LLSVPGEQQQAAWRRQLRRRRRRAASSVEPVREAGVELTVVAVEQGDGEDALGLLSGDAQVDQSIKRAIGRGTRPTARRASKTILTLA
jgi:hypothetical protein